MVQTWKDWHEMLSFTLVRTSTREMSFSIVYGMEVVLPIEVEIPSLRILTDVNLDEAEWVQARLY